MTRYIPKSILVLLLTSIELLSAQSVTDYGATGNGTTDDTVAIQNAINAQPSGATLTFPAGTYRVTSTLNAKGNLTYQGVGLPTLLGYQGTGQGGFPIMRWSTSPVANIKVDGIKFNGGGLVLIPNDGSQISNVTISNNDIGNIQNSNQGTLPCNASSNCAYANDPESSTAILALPGSGANQGLTGFTVTNNTIHDLTVGGTYPTWINACQSDCAVMIGMFTANSLDYTITYNTLTNIAGDAMYFPDESGTALPARHGPYLINHNTFNLVHKMAIEDQQGDWQTPRCVQNFHVDDNTINSWIQPYYNSFGMSLAVGCADGTSSASRNHIYLTTGSAGLPWSYGYGMELSVTTIDGNVIQVTPNGGTGPGAMIILIPGAPPSTISNTTACGPINAGGHWWQLNPNPPPPPPPASSPDDPANHNTYSLTCSATNLVRDPGFESQVGPGLGSPWSHEGPAVVGGDTGGTDPTGLPNAHGGTVDAFIWNGSTVTWTAITQTITVTQNTNYTLTGWFNNSAGFPTGQFGARTTSGTMIAQTTIPATAPYQQLTVSFNSGSNSQVVIFGGFAPSANSWLHMDDVSLVQASGPPPVAISGAAQNLTAVYSQNLTWTTNVAADSLVVYGQTTAYGSQIYDATLRTSHALTIPGLSHGITYYYKISSTANGSTASATGSFMP